MDYELLYNVSLVDAKILKIKKNVENRQKVRELNLLKKQYLTLKHEYEAIRDKEKEVCDKINNTTSLLSKKKEEKDSYTQNLYSTTNVKTIETCQNTVDRLTKDIENLNEDEYKLMMDNEELSSQKIEKYKKLTEIRDEYNKKLRNYKKNCEKDDKVVLKLKKERNGLISKVNEDVAKEYEMLVKESGCGMSEINGEICSGCNLDVPTVIIDAAKKGKRLTKCPNCGRFIYAPN